MDESLKADVMYWAAFYERRMRVGNKKIFHLEAWVVKVMSLYKVMYTSIRWIWNSGGVVRPQRLHGA
jgi:replication factor C subunit 3/5